MILEIISNVMQNNEVHNNYQLIANATHNTTTMHAGVTESKFHNPLLLSQPLQSVCCPIGWVVQELWVLIHSIRLAVGRRTERREYEQTSLCAHTINENVCVCAYVAGYKNYKC